MPASGGGLRGTTWHKLVDTTEADALVDMDRDADVILPSANDVSTWEWEGVGGEGVRAGEGGGLGKQWQGPEYATPPAQQPSP